MSVPAMRQIAVVACLFLLAAIVPAVAANESVLINFEQFPGPDGIIGTADDVPAPSQSPPSIIISDLLNNQFSSMGIIFTAGTLDEGSLFPGTASTALGET